MKKIKILTAFIMTLCILFSLSACFGGGETAEKETVQNTTEQANTTAPVTQAPTITEAPTEPWITLTSSNASDYIKVECELSQNKYDYDDGYSKAHKTNAYFSISTSSKVSGMTFENVQILVRVNYEIDKHPYDTLQKSEEVAISVGALGVGVGSFTDEHKLLDMVGATEEYDAPTFSVVSVDIISVSGRAIVN